MKIRRSTHSDIRTFRHFWDSALAYQKARQLPLWPPFPESDVEEEIRIGLHFASDFPDGFLAGYFSVALSDELIWAGEERGDAIYVHRMCVNPLRKGSNLARSVLAWSHGYASSLGRKFVRMDTWADNQRLVGHYVGCGFHYIGDRQLGDVAGLPPHYSSTRLALFQNAVDSLPAPNPNGRDVVKA
jgi:GNAT superfamily N-acetyltransferase